MAYVECVECHRAEAMKGFAVCVECATAYIVNGGHVA